MKWTECAMQDLRKYEGQKRSLANIAERISLLNQKNASMKRFRTDTIPGVGGSSDWTDVVLDDGVECERLKLLYQVNRRLINIVDRGLSALSDNEKLVLEKFYMKRTKNYLEELKSELKLEQTQVYRLKDEALYKFTINMYGTTEY